MPQYPLESYKPFFSGSGAEKLKSSGVAPLVALARGYRTYPMAGEGIRSRQEREPIIKSILGLAKPQDKALAANKINRMLSQGDDSDILFLPWYSASRVAEGKKTFKDTSFVQLRPRHIVADVNGESGPKYDSFKGSGTSVDAHVSCPADWLKYPRRVLITEGVLKGDSALTALLQSVDEIGIDGLEIPEAIAAKSGEDAIRAATKKLRSLMEKVPKSDRILIISLVGVGNWKSPDWSGISLKDTEALIAFDGDLENNYNVHRQYTKFSEFLADSKQAEPVQLLDLSSEVVKAQLEEAGRDKNEKVGIDDYLALDIGTWADALGLATTKPPACPPKPANFHFSNGDTRVSADGCAVEKFHKTDNEEGYWKPIDKIGGYILDTTVERIPAREEIDLGVTMETHARNEKIEATIRTNWKDDDGKILTADIIGPSAMLTTPPERWPTTIHIPAALATSNVWPPESGMKWLRAVKGNPKGKSSVRTKWTSMGWAPSTDGDPVFLIGQQVIGATREEELSVSCGLGEEDVSKASSFGVIDEYWDYVDPDRTGTIDPDGLKRYKKEVRRVVREVVKLFVTDRPWRDPAYGPIILSAMLRATMPTPFHGALNFFGQAQSGKSWTASVIMSAFGSRPGTWNNNNMPGGASDTKFATEQILSRMPIWVMDDNPPGLSRQAQLAKVEKLDELVRQITQGSTRRAGDKDGGLRQATEPRALLILTGEQEFELTSLRQRLVELRFGEGMLTGHDNLTEKLFNRNGEGLTARLSAMMIRYWHQNHVIREAVLKPEEERKEIEAWNAACNPDDKLIKYDFIRSTATTWQEKTSGQEFNRKALAVKLQFELDRQHRLPEKVTTRQANILSDLMVSVFYLQGLYNWAGGDSADLSELLDWAVKSPDGEEDGGERNTAAAEVVGFLARQIQGTEAGSPGRLLCKTIVTALSRGIGHIRGTKPGQPPLSAEEGKHPEEFARHNEMLGWRYDMAREVWVTPPNSMPIGYFERDEGEPVILFHKENAFSAADRTGAIPAGSSVNLSWKSAETDKLVEGGRKQVLRENNKRGQMRGKIMSWSKFLQIADEGDLSPDPKLAG